MAKNDKTVKRGVYLYLDGKEIKNDINSIDLEMKRLQRDIKDMTRGSEEYNRTMAKIQHLQGILKEHRQQIKGVTEETKKATVETKQMTTETKKASLSIGGMVDWFNRFGGVIVTVIGFLTGFTLALRSIRDERNKLEESKAGLKALTGLDDDNIAWLTEQAKVLSTTMTKEGLRVRQSAAEILDAFMMVGSAKPELLGDKEALKAVTEEAMRLQAAAKDISLSEAVDSLTLSLNQYGAAADQAGRFANVLAAGSKAGAANIASQSKAIRNAGTAAASANVPIEQTVALIETLAYRGIKDEVAGTGLKKFFLTLQTGADETNPKIVGLDKALENLKNKNMDAGAIKKMFGEEGFNTASVILQNTEMVKDFTVAVTGTNTAFEQAAINSDTAAAKLAQARNNMKLAAIDLAEKLNPALTVSTNMVTNVVKYLPGLIDWFKKWGGAITAILIPLTTYYTSMKLVALYHTTYNAVLRLGTTIQTAYRVATIALNDSLAGDYKAITRLLLQMRNLNMTTRLVTASTLIFRAATEALTFRFTAAAKAMRTAFAVLKFNPFVAIATSIAAVATGLYVYAQRTSIATRRQKELVDMNREAEKSISEEKNKLEALRKVLENSKEPYGKRKAALEEIQSIVPEYHASLTKEGELINNNTQALDGYVEKLLVTAKQQMANTKLQEALSQRSEWVKENGSDAMKFKNLEWEINDPVNMGKSMEELAVSNGVSPTAYLAWNAQKKRLDENVRYYENMMQNYTNQLMAINEKYKTVTTTTTPTTKGGGDGGSESEEEREKRVKKELEDIENKHMQQLTHLQKLYLEGKIETNEEYTALQIDLEKKTLDEKLAIVGLEAHEREKLQVKMLEAQIKFNEECKKQDEKTGKERFSIRQKQLHIELEKATADHYKNLTSEEDFAKEVNDIRQRYWDDLLNNYQLTEEQRTEIQKQQAKERTDTEKEQYDKTMKIHKQYASLVTDIASGFGETIGEMIATGELSLKNFLRETILMALDALERVIEISILEITAKNLAATAPLSFIGAAKAAVQVAAIKAAFAVVKGLVGNFYTGGYTPSGSWDQPQGIVHSNEFVANRFAVANPNLRPIFDVIDVAQRSGNVGNLTTYDIAAVASPRRTATASPAAAGASSAATTTNDPAMMAVMTECIRIMRRLKVRLDEPLVAETYVTGKHGVNQAQQDYQRLENNKSRNKK